MSIFPDIVTDVRGPKAVEEGQEHLLFEVRKAGRSLYIARRHQTCHFRKRATSVPAEGPAYGLDFAR